jgi:hypothetical protein
MIENWRQPQSKEYRPITILCRHMGFWLTSDELHTVMYNGLLPDAGQTEVVCNAAISKQQAVVTKALWGKGQDHANTKVLSHYLLVRLFPSVNQHLAP